MKRLPEVCLTGAMIILAGAAACLAAPDSIKPGPAGGENPRPEAGRGREAARPRKTEQISYRVASSQAVLAYLRSPGPETLAAALRTCLSVRERIPDDVFNGFLTAFCHHETGDAAAEARALSQYPPEQKNMYRFFFYERRGELADALHIIPAYLCKHLRELPNAGNAFSRGAKCPGFGGPVSGEKYRSRNKTYVRFVCPKCDGMIRLRKSVAGGARAAKNDDSLCPILFHVAYKFLDNRWRFTSKEYKGLEGFLSALGIREGTVVADIGCGNGQFTFPLAEKVGPKGRVYAEEIDERELELIRYCIEKGGLKNIVPVLGTPTDVNIPPGALDTAALIHVYRSILMGLGGRTPEYVDSFFNDFFAGIRKALKEDGALVLVDRIDPRFDVTAGKAAEALKKRGFQLVSDKSDLKERTIILFFKKAPKLVK